MMTVIEQPTVPKFMPTFRAFVEVEMIGPVKFVQPVEDVLARVRVHDVE